MLMLLTPLLGLLGSAVPALINLFSKETGITTLITDGRTQV